MKENVKPRFFETKFFFQVFFMKITAKFIRDDSFPWEVEIILK